jgi:diguanylate cyclase (GGDEF)-like protein
MPDDLDKARLRTPEQTVADDHADAMRMELLRLRQDLDQVQREFNDTRAAQLLEANEQLVLTALRAEDIAETAMIKLNNLTRVTQRDALTDTPNRALMLDRLQNAIAMAKRHEARIAVLFVDIDHFKRVNDRYGHAAGDAVLQLVARRLEAAVRESDTVSRHSGDEFLILLAEITQASDAALIARKMLAAVAGPSEEAQPFPVSASVGIAIYPDDGVDARSLIERADEAMYRAKNAGGGRFEFHSNDPSLDASGKRRLVRDDGSAQGAQGEQQKEMEQHQLHDLRDANEQLVLSSLAAHEAQEQATQTQRRQVKFLAMVAHELRNPLAPLRTAAELLNRARADEKQHGKLQEIIKRQVAHMGRIVDDLLDGSRVDSGKFHLECSTVELIGVLNVAIDSCRPAMDAKLQHVRTQLPLGPLAVHGDPVRLAQIFRNLLDNATKYTHKGGGIAVTAVVIHQAVVITVSDNGIGIAAEALPRVFDLFVQDPRAVAAHGSGLGIGLAVVRELVEAHGGRVVASSAGPDLGSEFVVTLPVVAGGSYAV